MSIILFFAACFLVVGVALVLLVMLGKRKDIHELPRDPKFWIEADKHGGSTWDGTPLVVDDYPIYDVLEMRNN